MLKLNIIQHRVSVHTKERLWRRDICDGTRVTRHIWDRFCVIFYYEHLSGQSRM